MEANDAVPAGAQLFITYGRQTNDRLLQFYGFSEADNPYDTYVVCDLKAAVEVTTFRERISQTFRKYVVLLYSDVDVLLHQKLNTSSYHAS